MSFCLEDNKPLRTEITPRWPASVLRSSRTRVDEPWQSRRRGAAASTSRDHGTAPVSRTSDLRRRCSAPQQGPLPPVRRGRWSISYSLYYLLAAPRNREGTFFAPHDKSSRNGRLLHGRPGGGRASGYLGERGRQHRARAAATRRGAAVGGGPLGVKPERTRIYACAICPRKRQLKATTRCCLACRCPLSS